MALRAFADMHVCASHADVYVAGHVDSAQAEAAVRLALGGLPAPPPACPQHSSAGGEGGAQVWLDQGRLRWMMPPLEAAPLAQWLDKGAMVGHEWTHTDDGDQEAEAEARTRACFALGDAALVGFRSTCCTGPRDDCGHCGSRNVCAIEARDGAAKRLAHVSLQWCCKGAIQPACSLPDLVSLAAAQVASLVLAARLRRLGMEAALIETLLPDEDCAVTCLAVSIPACTCKVAELCASPARYPGARADWDQRAGSCCMTAWPELLASFASTAASVGRMQATQGRAESKGMDSDVQAAKSALLQAYGRRADRLQRASASCWAERLAASVDCHRTLQSAEVG